jgi:hypothetical protein
MIDSGRQPDSSHSQGAEINLGEGSHNWATDTPPLFNDEEITRLKIRNYSGALLSLLSCLLPYFDTSNHEMCVRITDDGRDILRVHPTTDILE